MKKILKIEKIQYSGFKYDIEVEKTHNYYANGVLVHNCKADGRFNHVIILDDTITSESRQGETVYLNDNFDSIFRKDGISNIVLDGELIIPNVSRYKSNGMISSIISINKKIKNGDGPKKDIIKFEKKYNTTVDLAIDSIHYVCWDVITYDEYLKAYSDNDYDYRLDHLDEVIAKLDNPKVTALETTRLNSIDDVKPEFIRQVLNGEEGICVKGLSTKWKDGKGNGQIKVKEIIMLDLVITSFNYGTKGTKNENVISSLTVESSDGLLKTRPTGITEERMEYITQHQSELLNTIVTVKCSGISQDVDGNYSLLHPVFDELRDDKLIANSLQECFDIVESSRQL